MNKPTRLASIGILILAGGILGGIVGGVLYERARNQPRAAISKQAPGSPASIATATPPQTAPGPSAQAGQIAPPAGNTQASAPPMAEGTQLPKPKGNLSTPPKNSASGGHEAAPRGPVYQAGEGGVSYPSCLYCPRPEYSDQARRSKYQGTVALKVTVLANGRARPDSIEVTKSIGMGLDENAVAAVRNWRFKPAIGPNGKPVNAIVEVEVQFELF